MHDAITLQWRHNERSGVSHHQPHECLPNGLFPAQMASNAENVSIWRRHHDHKVHTIRSCYIQVIEMDGDGAEVAVLIGL